jgi:hypothetical protein
MNCPNCGIRHCRCTWNEQAQAIQILRRRGAEFRRKIGHETVVEADRRERRERIGVGEGGNDDPR